MRRRRTVVVHQPGLHAAQRQPDPAGPSLARGQGADGDQGSLVPYRSTGGWPVSSASLSNTGTGSAALPDTSSRADDNARAASASSTIARPHRRHPEVQRALGLGVTRGCGFSGVHEAVSDPQRPQQAEHQAVDVEQRKPVHQGVVGRPLPRLGQRVDVGGDGAAADQHTLRRSGGSGGVHDQRGGLRRRFGVAVP